MATMIRTHTFLKYARINLQEAEAALQEDHPELAAGRCSDAVSALIKALVAAVPLRAPLSEFPDHNDLKRIIEDLADNPVDVRELPAALLEAKSGSTVRSRAEAEALFSRAGQLFRAVHDLCVQ